MGYFSFSNQASSPPVVISTAEPIRRKRATRKRQDAEMLARLHRDGLADAYRVVLHRGDMAGEFTACFDFHSHYTYEEAFKASVHHHQNMAAAGYEVLDAGVNLAESAAVAGSYLAMVRFRLPGLGGLI